MSTSQRLISLLRLPLTLWAARLLLATVGLGLVVLGAVVAWNAQSSTPLMIVGAVLAVLGLFKWKRIGLAYGDASADAELDNAQQQVEEAIIDTKEVAERKDLPADVTSLLNATL